VPPCILHVDMDAFFVAVEVLDCPSLAGRPVVVGGSGPRGVVASASYEARAYGVRSAMPSGQARRLCPTAVFIPGNYERYSAYSVRIHEIFGRITPLVEGIALDEAFLDITGSTRLFGSPMGVAENVRASLRSELGLSACVGIAGSKLMAKLASEAAKPVPRMAGVIPGRGIVQIQAGDELAFLHPLPVRALWGVGPATAARLHRMGVSTVGELAKVPVAGLEAALGRSQGRALHDLAWARDSRSVEPARAVKSVGQERTYPKDRYDPVELRREVLKLAESAAGRMRTEGLAGRTVTLKVRFGDFTTITRAETLTRPVSTGAEVAAVANGLLDHIDLPSGVRLLGVSISQLGEPGAEQLALDFDEAGGRSQGPGGLDRQRAARAVDRIRQRFGDRFVGPASLLGENGIALSRRGQQAWGPEASGNPKVDRP
jgi:DNA polymerase-4